MSATASNTQPSDGLRFGLRLGLLVVACAAGLFSFDLVMGEMLLLPAALVFLLLDGLRWLRWLRARAGGAADRRPKWRLPITVALAASWFGGYGLHVRLAERQAEPLIAAAERFRTEHGRYPRNVAEFGAELFAGFERVRESNGRLIGLSTRSLLGFRYGTYSAREDRFTIGFVTFGFNKHDYSSATNRWRNWD